MLKAMWPRPACRKPPVTSRYHSPSATALPCSAKSLTTEPLVVLRPPLPPAISARKASALRPIRTKVAGAAAKPEPPATGPLVTRVRCREHSGQRMPTGVGVMHAGQIGRPQEEQETPVSRSGCR